MKVKRFWSVFLVIVMLAATFPTDRAIATVGPFSGHMNSYIWSRDYSQVTAVDIHYSGNTDDQGSSSAYRESITKSETVNTVATTDADGYVTYTATFSDPDFTAQSRRIYDADDVVKKWDFEAAADVNDWTLSGFVRSNGNEYYRERIGRNGEYYLLANDENNLAPEISTSVTLPENACLTFWAGGGVEVSGDTITVYCGEEGSSMEPVWSGNVSYQADGNHFSSYWCFEHLGIDPKQFFVDLSAYSGKQVYLKIVVTIPKHTYYDPPYNLRYPYDILIDDVEIRDGSWCPLQSVPMDSYHFPDPAFFTYVSNIDKDGNGCLNADELDAVARIDVGNSEITSLKGIGYFTKLETLFCSDNLLSSLDLSKNTALQYLDCCGNQLTSLDVSKCSALYYLECDHNQFSSLDLSGNPLLGEAVLIGERTEYPDYGYVRYFYNDATIYTDLGVALTTAAPPVITTQPANKSVAAGANATFNVVATGEGLTYQWQYSDNGTTWTNCKSTGYNTATFSFKATAGLNNRQYHCVVTNAGGSVTSSPATLTVTSASTMPTITTQPKTQTVTAGTTVTFKVVATGATTYQWQYKTSGGTWTNCKSTGYNTATFSFKATASLNGRQYRCVVSNAADSVNSSAATLTVTSTSTKPTITTQPKAQTVTAGTTVTFKVVATGATTYQWQYKTSGGTWTNCKSTGYNTATFSFKATASLNGRQYRCKVSNAADSVTSSAATLTVTSTSTKPTITTQPKAQTVTAGTTVTFKVAATGATAYQWQYSKNNGASWTTWSGKTSASLTVTASTTNNGCLYRCKVSNAAGSVTSSKVRLTVSDVKPTILTQPAAESVTAGTTVSLKVVAAGTGLTYQWQYSTNGSTWTNCKSTGYNTATFSFKATATLNGRQYRCVVSNASGDTNSSAATLTVK